ncbi:MAG TPA: DUF6453 family protein [Arsenophonus apicola]|uniref:DUF6453 family protein n=1 Tax=Arsenophonus apicola TaxID=2879119 RepID=UPI00387A7C86
MTDFGFFVDLNDGFKQFEITSKSQILTKLLSATNPDFKKRDHSYTIPDADKYHLIVVPKVIARLYFVHNSYVVRPLTLENIRIEGNQLKFSFEKWGIHWYWGGIGGGISQRGTFIYDGEYQNRYQIDVYGYPKQGTAGDYGLFLGGLGNAVEITQQSKLGYCVFRKKITISANDTYTIPSNVPSIDKSLVFIRPTNQNAIVSISRDNKKIYSTAQTDVYVLVFATDFTLVPADYGLNIYNSKGILNYSSNYLPFLVGENITLTQWGVAAPFARPMLQANECAEMIDRIYRDWTYCRAGGYRFQGNKITIQPGRNLEWVFVDTSAIDYISYSTPSYVIDFDLYF